MPKAMLFLLAALASVLRPTAAEPQGLGGGGPGYSTLFEGFGVPYGGCGVPQGWEVDDAGAKLPFVALNTFSDVAGTQLGLFAGGANCGRWLRMTVCTVCEGGSNDRWEVCKKGATQGLENYVADDLTGRVVLYGYVGDSCGDSNAWCRADPYHLDMSSEYVASKVPGRPWRNRVVSWEFIDGPPPEYAFASSLKIGWVEGAYLPYYPAIIVHGTVRGVSAVSSRTASGEFAPATQNAALGQQWVLSGSTDFSAISIRVSDASGAEYGEYPAAFPCGSGKCAAPTL